MLLPLYLFFASVPEVVVVRVSLPYAQKRTPVRVDPVEWEWVKIGHVDTSSWKPVTAEKDGTYRGDAFAGGYAMAIISSTKDQKVFLNAVGHSMVYVNGVPRVGDPYSYGYVSLPIKLNKGRNELLFATGRGELKIKFEPVEKNFSVDLRDLTAPDQIGDDTDLGVVGVVVRNATDAAMTIDGDQPIPPMSVRKVRVFPRYRDGEHVANIQLDRTAPLLTKIPITKRKIGEPYRKTFTSDIDGSVQYYAVNPCKDPDSATALIMSLHGASVEAIGQAQAYGQKDWADIVCPTNRRPFGFDWEDVGRKDFDEVLSKAGILLWNTKTQKPKTLLLTGHSMGGHGTWNVAAHYANMFDAISPCAGWVSFFSYAGGVKWPETDPVGSILNRASAPSDTLQLKNNFSNVPIFMVHGDADDNVPVTEARTMLKELSGISPQVKLYEEPGAGHWWDKDPAPGADSVDYRPMMDWMKAISPRSRQKSGQVSCVNPALLPASNVVRITQQMEPLKVSQVRWNVGGDTVEMHTVNVDRLEQHLDFAGKTIVIDGKPLPVADSYRKIDNRWTLASSNPDVWNRDKNPQRNGPFKEIFDHRIVFVYGTAGSEEETKWNRNKAQFDAEQFWYRGNGSISVLSDKQWLKNKYWSNVLLYGNSDTNSAWSWLLGSSPLQVKNGQVKVGDRTLVRDDLAVMFIRPRLDTPDKCVGAIAPTGMVGARLSERQPLFSAGAGFPDWLILSPEMLKDGLSGIPGAGFFGTDWSVSWRNSAWRLPGQSANIGK